MTADRDRSDEPELPALASLPREIDPPPALESRVLAAIQSQAASGRPGLGWRQWAAAAALVVISLAAGIAIGRYSRPTPPIANRDPRFMLLMWNSGGDNTDPRAAEEYRRWAMAQSATGRRVSGERLSDEAVVVEPSRTVTTVPEIDGFFVVSAKSLDDAIAVARSSPHVQAGGRVVVRPINTP